MNIRRGVDGTMSFISRSRLNPLILLITVVCWTPGCGPANNRVAVEGVVTLDGAPVEGASVMFVPTGGGRPGMAVTQAGGVFVMKEAGMNAGLQPGEYVVVIYKAVMKDVVPPTTAKPVTGASGDEVVDATFPPPEQVVVQYIVPERYSRRGENGLSITVRGAVKDLRFQLTTHE